MSGVDRPHAFALLALLAVAACVLAYAAGLTGPFVFDSAARVAHKEALAMTSLDAAGLLRAAYAGEAAYPERGLVYVSFALNHLLAGGRFSPLAFKLTNLVVHLVNAVAVFFLARAVIGRWLGAARGAGGDTASRVAWTALLAAALWLLHPIQLTSVLYVVQRMTSLAAFWVFLGATVFLAGRERLERDERGALTLMASGIVAGTAIGFFCKQNALLLPFLCGVLELCLFDARALPRRSRRRLAVLYASLLGLPLLGAVTALALRPELVVDGYAYREFGLAERVMTQARVLFFYLRLLALPDPRAFGLYHDDFPASAGLLAPWTTLLALAAWLALAGLALARARRRAPWALAVLWFLVAHGAESGLVALELVHEHRNYVPSAALAMAAAYYVARLADAGARARHAMPAIALGCCALLAFVTGVRAASWRDAPTLMATLARHHPGSYRAAIGFVFNVVPADADLGVRFAAFQRAAVLNDHAITALVEMASIAAVLEFALAGRPGAGERAGAAAAGVASHAIDVGSLRLEAKAAAAAELRSALDGEIRRRLAVHAVRTDSVVALLGAVECVLARSRYCAGLEEAIDAWHVTALGNERLRRSDRAVLELSLARLDVLRGRHDLAVARARRAGEIAPENIDYRIQAAYLYAALERWDELGEALRALRRDAPAGGAGYKEIGELERRYRER